MEDKLLYLDMGAGREATLSRLEGYRRLFAYRYSKAIVTRPGGGPRAWVALRHHLGLPEIARHLLADRLPNTPPIWFGARSLPTSAFLCLDVDADSSSEDLLAEKGYDVKSMPEDYKAWLFRKIVREKPKPPFTDRCSQVERALRRMGIRPESPRSVLVQTTPRGGRHYYVFFDRPHFLEQYRELLQAAGLRHVPGQTEFYPSTKQALRLPFGFVPGQAHDPAAWIQFTDDHRNGRIIRHSLGDLYEHLGKHRATQYRRQQSRRSTAERVEQPPGTEVILGVPKSDRKEAVIGKNPIPVGTEPRYRELLGGIHSRADADELLSIGILLPGTRTQVLKHLAAHLVWFRHHPAEEAAHILTDWAMDPRHVSKDIAQDLASGTSQVAKQIECMCRWYEARRETSRAASPNAVLEFSSKELEALQPCLKPLPPEARKSQAEFFLHFLRFAKRHGSAEEAGLGWDAAPAIRQVVRRWPGCHHMHYKDRINHAMTAGIMKAVRGPWHPAKGPGRATTYRLFVPVVPRVDWVLNYEAAMGHLTGDAPLMCSPGK